MKLSLLISLNMNNMNNMNNMYNPYNPYNIHVDGRLNQLHLLQYQSLKKLIKERSLI